MADKEKRTVCVTGAGGFLASCLVKLLLSKGYFIHGTVQDPDLLHKDSLRLAIEGCTGVFHVASPLPSNHSNIENPEKELIELDVDGTLNVLKTCVKANVNRVITVSSGTAVIMNPNRPKDRAMDETCWSDPEFQKSQ